jgi:hypothetical protein
MSRVIEWHATIHGAHIIGTLEIADGATERDIESEVSCAITDRLTFTWQETEKKPVTADEGED